MEIIMKDILKMVKKMVMVESLKIPLHFMKGILKMINLKVKVYMLIEITLNMRESLSIIRCMGLVKWCKRESFMREYGRIISVRD